MGHAGRGRSIRSARASFVLSPFVGFTLLIWPTLAASLLPSPSHAQIQASAKRKCIIAINKSATKTARAQDRQVAGCVKDAILGRLSALDVSSCIATPGVKLVSAQAKTLKREAKRCSVLPDFGYSSGDTANSVATGQQIALAGDVYGDDVGAAIVTDASDARAARCQRDITKRYQRLSRDRLRAFLDCKKDGLNDGTIASEAELAACMDTMLADPRGRIAKARAKLLKSFAKRCLGIADVNGLFPGDCLDAADLPVCLEERTVCRACLHAADVDNLGVACELFGDGVVDGSCADPNANECLGQNGGDNCHANATCTDEAEGFSCTCLPGYAGDGVVCVDIDECVEGSHDCDPDATCTNSLGSFSCACNAGFLGDGRTCTDVDECANGTAGCGQNATCTNTPGSFTCTCDAGYAGDGVTCVDVDECTEGIAGCDDNASCTNTLGSFFCTCHVGYHGDGMSCTDDDECIGEGSGNNCSVGAECTNLPGTFDCQCPKGYFGDPFGSVCEPFTIALTTPTHGSFTQAGSIGVTGVVTADDVSDITVTVGGSPAAVAPDGSFTASLVVDAAAIFNEVRAVLTHDPSGFVVRDRRVVIAGESAPMGGLVEQSVALRINDSGFDALEPVLETLVDFDIAELLPPGTVIADDVCFVDSFLGCVISGDVIVRGASLGGFSIDVDSMMDFVAGDIRLDDIVVDLDVELNVGTCGLRVEAATTNIFGDYTLEPDPADANVIDVNQLGSVNVVFGGFTHDFTSGACGFPGIEEVVNAVIGDIEAQVRTALVDFLDDPDGAGPQDAAVAQAIEDALAGLEIAGPIGAGFGVDLQTPLFAIPEDLVGLTLASGAIMETLNPLPGAPTFARTLVIPASFPTAELASETTPGGVPYDLALAVADSAFNQILAAQVESGLLQAELSEIDINGDGTPDPLTAGLFSFVLPEFGQLDPSLQLVLRVVPTLAPVVTGTTGPDGEIAELIVSHLLIDVVSGPPAMERLHARIVGDLATAFDLVVEPGTGNLLPVLAEPEPEDVVVTLLDNPLCLDEAQLQLVVPVLLTPLVPELSGLFGAFPLPQFIGVQPTAVEISRVGDFLGVFLSASPAP